MNKILIGVLSGWQYPKRRARVLSTLMKDVAVMRYPAPAPVDAVLLLGVLKARATERHGDLLFLPCPDSYQHLPQKTRLFCRWAVQLPWWDYLLKTDDDTRLDLQRLLAYDTKGADYIGPEWKPGVGYASGNGYLLSRKAAEIVAANPDEQPGFSWEGTVWDGAEDVLTGQLLAKAGIRLTIDNKHFRVLTEHGEAPGIDNEWVYCSPRLREPE